MWDATYGNHNNELEALDTLAKAREYAGYARLWLLKVNNEQRNVVQCGWGPRLASIELIGDTWYTMNGNIAWNSRMKLRFRYWMEPVSGIQERWHIFGWSPSLASIWTNGVTLIDYLISGVLPESGAPRWSLHLLHCAHWGFLGPPDVVRGTMVWNGYSVGQPIILSTPIKVVTNDMTLGYYVTWLLDLNFEWTRGWKYMTLGNNDTMVRYMIWYTTMMRWHYELRIRKESMTWCTYNNI